MARRYSDSWSPVQRRATRLVGWLRASYRRWLRTREAYALRVQRGELRWSGRPLADDELRELVSNLKEGVPW